MDLIARNINVSRSRITHLDNIIAYFFIKTIGIITKNYSVFSEYCTKYNIYRIPLMPLTHLLLHHPPDNTHVLLHTA